jgi:hypothetical protein
VSVKDDLERARVLLTKCLPYISMVRMQGSSGADELLRDLLAFGIEKPKLTMKRSHPFHCQCSGCGGLP